MLYRLIRDLKIPHYPITDRLTGNVAVQYKTIPAIPTMNWPDGTPAILLDMYLLDMTHKYTVRRQDGGSLKVLSSSLTHLLRIAYERKCALWEMNDLYMKEALASLQNELDHRNPRKKRRDPNTIKYIIDYWIDFFRWLQETIIVDRVIVGKRSSYPQIPLEPRTHRREDGSRTISFYYRYEPPSSTPRPKGPIARQLRIKLWDAIQEKSDSNLASPKYRGAFATDADFLFEIQYLRKRRELVFELLERTGRRPLELCKLLVSENFSCSLSKRLRVATVKRRRYEDPKHDIPITFQLAQRIEVFIAKYRNGLLDRLRSAGKLPNPADHLLLGINGMPISPDTLRKELNRLAKFAGVTSERVCMSMFRHRFITNQVKAHLRSFLKSNPALDRSSITKADYRVILHRVARVTGHSDELSLLEYVDLAWDELGVFDEADDSLALLSTMDTTISSLTSLLGDLVSTSDGMNGGTIQLAIQQIRQLREGIVDFASIKAHPSENSSKP